MASAWGKSWGAAWGNAWGKVLEVVASVNGSSAGRDKDRQNRISALQNAMRTAQLPSLRNSTEHPDRLVNDPAPRPAAKNENLRTASQGAPRSNKQTAKR